MQDKAPLGILSELGAKSKWFLRGLPLMVLTRWPDLVTTAHVERPPFHRGGSV